MEAGWVTKIPTVGQMILGFTLPFALAFVAIPLEYFINSGRIVLGAVLVLVLRGLAFALRLSGQIVQGSREARRRVLRRDHLCAARDRALGCQPPARMRAAARRGRGRPSGKFATADNEEAL